MRTAGSFAAAGLAAVSAFFSADFAAEALTGAGLAAAVASAPSEFLDADFAAAGFAVAFTVVLAAGFSGAAFGSFTAAGLAAVAVFFSAGFVSDAVFAFTVVF